MYILVLLVVSSWWLAGLVLAADFEDPAVVTRIAFGSCAHQDRDQPLWSDIAKWDPDYFIWLGDAVYSDTKSLGFLFRRPGLTHYSEQLYKMKTKPDYQSFLRRRTKVVGVWDDHDYGVNDGGITDDMYTAAVQDMFLHFLDEPEESPRWTRRGLYGSYLLGQGEHRLKLILLDPRSQLNRRNGTVLGEAQWAWLDNELKTDPTPLTILGTGLPLLTERITVDKWLLYPQERERLLGLISRRPNTIIISGDSHFGEMQCSNTTRGPLFEITSSGMTHNCLDWVPDFLCDFGAKYIASCPGCVSQAFVDLNYGTLSIQWSPDPRVIMEVRGRQGTAIHYMLLLDKIHNERCPSPVFVKYQRVWQVIGISSLTLIVILPLYLASYFFLSLHAKAYFHPKLTKHHSE